MEKVIYVIEEIQLSKIMINEANSSKEIPASCYFGIKPFNNHLWSGDYQPHAANAPIASFNNIDLDRSLRLVLAKIDELLQAVNISATLPLLPAQLPDLMDIYEKLLSGKKSLIETKLKGNIDWVMDDKQKPQPGDDLLDEFKNLLLNSLSDFYSYDGLAKVTLSGTNILPPDCRLNVTLLADDQTNTTKGYKLYASKIGDHKNEWFLFFDQQEKVIGNINVFIKPLITHIEYDIKTEAQSEIQESQWIQLITPAELEADKYKISDWTKIAREFPEKPVILKHRTDQNTPDTGLLKWNINELGLWNYALGIKDSYVQNDNIHVDLVIDSSKKIIGMAKAAGDFNGFIAYWGASISSPDNVFKWKDFVADLFNQFNNVFAAAINRSGMPAYSFDLKKNAGKWEIKNITAGLTVKFPKDQLGKPQDTNPDVLIGPFNIFNKTKRVVSILPLVKVFRNPDVKNEAFIYETETVSPVSTATPHIRYFTPLSLQSTETFQENVFGTVALPIIPNELPLKATAKYLIKTADDFPGTTKNLPVIPIQQTECMVGTKPSVTDKLFDDFDKLNGFQAFTLTVYNAEKNTESDLPVFYAETIFKQL